MRTRLWLAAAACLFAAAAPAADFGPGPRFSIAGGETVASGGNALSAEFGFPSVTFGFTHGLTDTTDAGFKVDLLYGYESTTTTQLGYGLRVPLRAIAFRTGAVSLLVHFDPGMRIYPASGGRKADVGMEVPLGAVFGIAVQRDLRISAGFDLPATVRFAPDVDLFLGPLFGLGVEYAVDRDLLVGLATRFGPIFSTRAQQDVSFGFVTQVVVGYRI